jgi:two-component system response regulator YesN
MRVLIVDDESHVTEGLQAMIDWQSLGICQVDVASNGVEAWDAFQRNKPDLLLTDVAMPRLNGLELAGKIRQVDSEIPIIILSGYDDFEYAREAIHLHVSRYILKPTVYTEIQEVLKEVIVEMEAVRKQQKYTKDFFEQMKQSLPILREQFLFDTITSGKRNSDFSDSQLQFYEIDRSLTEGGLVLSLMLYRSDSERISSDKDWQMFKYAALNIAQEIVSASPGVNYVLRYIEDRLPILCLDAVKEDAIDRAHELASQIMKNITVYLGIDSNVGIGRWYGAISNYPLSHRESVETLKSIEYEGFQKIGSFEEIKGLSTGWPDYPLEQVRLLCEAVQRHNTAEVIERWGEIEDRLMAPGISNLFVQTACVTSISWLKLVLGAEGDALLDTQLSLAVVQEILKCRSKESMLALVKKTLSQLLETARLQYSSNQDSGYVSKVIRYIEEHYHESISFAELAKQLYVTRNYLSYLFKRETGISYIAYLTRYRIERSKELLKTKQYMIYEIAEKVGYSDPAYFSRVFKIVMGMSPLEYAYS